MEKTAIDDEAYRAVKDAMGEIFNELIQTFQAYVPQQISQLGEAIAQADSAAVFNAAHAIKSASGTIGALGLASTAEHIEQLGRADKVDDIGQHYRVLQEQYQQAIDFLLQDNTT